MGNQLIKDTHIEKESIGNGGIGSQWEMHSGHRLDKNKAPVTIFLFEKKTISKISSSIRDDALALIKKEPQSLARFKHPGILSLVDPLLEDQKSMGFVTEATKGSLQTLINNGRVTDVFPTELDTKFHLLEIAETISFLHNDVKSCHLSLNPENIYVLAEEKWKLGGFPFTTQIMQGGIVDTNIDFKKFGDLKLAPSLKFTAPEVASNPSKGCFASDMFSFGCLIYTLYKINQDKNTNSPYLMDVYSHHDIQDAAKNLYKQNLSCIPEQIRPTVVRMLNPDPKMRIPISEFLNLQWFKDPFIQTVKHLETLYQKEVPQQQVFIKGIAQIILRFEKKFIISKILPLLNNLMKNEQLASSIIPIYFLLIDNELTPVLSKEEFQTIIWPSIKNLTTGKNIPAQALYLLIQNSHLIVDIGDVKEIQTVFVPLLIKSYECGVPKLQILALQKTESLFNKIEYTVSKSQILPRILHLCLDQNLALRKESIVLLSKIYSVFDKTTINDQVLTTLEKVRKLNNNFKINMTMLSIFEGISKNIGIDVIANKILVSMLPMLVDQTLSKPEYKAYMSTVRAYLNRIEEEQNKHFQGMPDTPPQEEFEEDTTTIKKQPKPEIKPTGAGSEFAFLDLFNGGGSSSSNNVASTSSGGDFDLSAFDEQFGMSKTPSTTFGRSSGGSDFQSNNFGWNQTNTQTTTTQNQSSSGGIDFSSLGNPKPKSNPMVIKPQQKPAQNQNPTTNTNTAGAGGKNLKSLGNPFNNAPNQQNQKQGLDSINFGNEFNQQNQNTNMFANMKVNKPNNPAQNTMQFNVGNSGGGWDNLDNELNSLSPSDNFNKNQNQGFGMSSNMNTGYNNNQANNNQFQFNQSGNNNNQGGWDSIDIDLGGGFGNNTGPSTNMGGGFNQGFNMNNNMQGQVKFNQGGFNQPKPNPQPNTMGQFGFQQNNANKAPFSSSDDFFSSFDVQKSGNKKNTQNYNNNDLI